ncbi:MAG: restriction endonuclease subunit S [Ignavibacteriaceae bacterium]|nr:restriction endonuclease subunit S [Ignavibacteriaceae bacterium]
MKTNMTDNNSHTTSNSSFPPSDAVRLPHDWVETTLGEVVNHVKNNIIPSKEPSKIFSHYSIPSFDDGKKAVSELRENILSNKYEVISKSFLVSKLNPSTPRIWTIFEPEENAICYTEFQVFQPKNEKHFAIYHCFLNSQIFTDELSQKAHGTSSSHQRVKPQDILDLDFFIPNETDILSFQEKVLPLLEKITDNSEQIQSLSQTRDELLPRLMRGEVRVDNLPI